MSDFLAVKPWRCDDKDCSHSWHLALYDIDEITGEHIASEFGDGDWEPCEPCDVPSWEASRAAWAEYYRETAQTGNDPLSQFMVKTERVKKRRFLACVRSWIGQSRDGILLVGVCARYARPRRLGETVYLPGRKQVYEYLNAERRNGRLVLPWALSIDQLKQEAGSDARFLPRLSTAIEAWFEFECEIRHPRPRREIEREIQRLAQEALRTP